MLNLLLPCFPPIKKDKERRSVQYPQTKQVYALAAVPAAAATVIVVVLYVADAVADALLCRYAP
jgi:hypothetical protein